MNEFDNLPAGRSVIFSSEASVVATCNFELSQNHEQSNPNIKGSKYSAQLLAHMQSPHPTVMVKKRTKKNIHVVVVVVP